MISIKTIGENIREERIKRNYSNKELSLLSGVARGYLHELEINKYKNPSMNAICKISKALKLTPNDLIPESEYK